MFQLQQTPFGKFTRYDIQHPETGNGFSIVPALGATVLDLRFGGQSILDGYDSPEALVEGKWGKSSVLFPFPNRLKQGKYQWEGVQYQFPINNATTGNAIHGFVREEVFEVEYCFLANDGASLRCFYEYDGRRAYYPFPFLLELEFTISNDGVFRVQAEVNNTGTRTLPMGFGWHPYFRMAKTADAHRLQLPACERIEIDPQMIPTGQQSAYTVFEKKTPISNTNLDNCFSHQKNTGSPKIKLTGQGRQIVVAAAANQFPYFQVFTPPHRESVALEPMSCNIDAFNNGDGLQALGAGKQWKGKMTFTLKEN
jgi:aldose 1-epimerase